MENDVNVNQPVTDSGVVQPTPATESVSPVTSDASVTETPVVQEQPTQVTTETLADGTTSDKPIPYSRFAEVNAQNKEFKDRIAQLETFIQAQPQQPQAQPAQQQPESQFVQVAREMGYDPQGYLSFEEQARVNEVVLQRIQSQNAAQMQAQTYVASKPDYAQVVGHQDPITGQFVTAPPLQRKLNENPGLVQAIQSSQNPTMLAYEIASTDSAYIAEKTQAQKPVEVQQSEAAQQAIAQANTIQSVSAVAGQGSLDRVEAIRSMSDEQFRQHKNQIMQRA